MNQPIRFTFETDPQFAQGIGRLAAVLGFEQNGGIAVTAQEADLNGVSLHGGRAVIRYTRKHQFFRQLGILFEHAWENDFEQEDDGHFTEVSVMLDTSRGAVPTVETVCRMIDHLALMGYSMAMLYTEDTIQLEGRPYFGYMRGRYTPEELRAMDDYAWAYGIELIPCLECYGHMAQYLRWPEAAAITDTSAVLLAREEQTFAFLEDLLRQVTACFRSNRVHIGMDEAWDMGRGQFLTRNGYVPPFQIFNEYMERLIAITDKLGLVPMMWSDMYFRVCSKEDAYYEDITLPPEVTEHIPKGVELVFWHYGEKPFCDDYMLQKHKALGREVIYAGGLWSWIGHFPEHNYMMETVRFSLDACRKNDVRRAMQTLWLNDNGECDLFANLFGLSFFAELCYRPQITENELASRFRATCNGDWTAFYTMSLYHNRFEGGEEYANFHDRFFGKPLFYQDLMEGLYDARLWERPMSGHYAACAEKMAAYTDGPWAHLYDFAHQIFAYLALKTKIHETLVPAYQAGDKENLRLIADELIPLLKKQLEGIHLSHRALWHKQLKPFGWRGLDDRYGGLILRCDTARMLLDHYLAGETDSLPQLEEPRLPKALGGFARYTSHVM